MKRKTRSEEETDTLPLSKKKNQESTSTTTSESSTSIVNKPTIFLRKRKIIFEKKYGHIILKEFENIINNERIIIEAIPK